MHAAAGAKNHPAIGKQIHHGEFLGDALALDAPAAAAIERKPAVDRRHIGPLREAARYDFVHGG